MTDESASSSGGSGGSGSSGADRRQFERFAARIEVRFPDASDAARAFRAYSLNFSVGGLCVKTQRPYVIGDSLRLELVVEGHDTIAVAAEVAWMRQGAIGLRFVDVPDDVRQELATIADAFKR